MTGNLSLRQEIFPAETILSVSLLIMKSSNQETSNLLLKKPTDNKCSSKHFQKSDMVWNDIYTLPRCETKDASFPLSQYILFVTQCFTTYQNALENIFKFGETVSLCPFNGRNSSPNTSFSFVHTNKISVESTKAAIQTG